MKAFALKINTALLGTALAVQSVFAGDCDNPTGINKGACQAKADDTPAGLFGGGGAFHVIANTLIYLVGAIAVIMLIVGGLRYVASQGSSDQVKQAKDTILYAIIGIVVAVLAYAIVNFVSNALT